MDIGRWWLMNLAFMRVSKTTILFLLLMLQREVQQGRHNSGLTKAT